VTIVIRVVSILCGVLPGVVLLLGAVVLINGALTSFVSYPATYLNEPYRGLGLLGMLALSVMGVFGFIGLVSVSIGGTLANSTRIRFLWLGVVSAAISFPFIVGPTLFKEMAGGKDHAIVLAFWSPMFFGPIAVGLFHIILLKRLRASDLRNG